MSQMRIVEPDVCDTGDGDSDRYDHDMEGMCRMATSVVI